MPGPPHTANWLKDRDKSITNYSESGRAPFTWQRGPMTA